MIDLTPAAIGFIGAILGALIGITGTIVSNRQQVIRRERELRREVYTEFLGSALAMSKVQDRSLEQMSSHMHYQGLTSDLMRGGRKDRKLALALASEHLTGDPLEVIRPDFDRSLADFLFKTHRLEVSAHQFVWETAIEMYDTLGCYLAFYPSDIRSAARSHFNDCLRQFTHASRWDLKAPAHLRRAVISRRHRELLEAGKALQEEAQAFRDEADVSETVGQEVLELGHHPI